MLVRLEILKVKLILVVGLEITAYKYSGQQSRDLAVFIENKERKINFTYL
jgi:hypothetical protein